MFKRVIMWYGSWDGATRNLWTHLILFQICRPFEGEKRRLEIETRNENLQKLALLKAKGRDNWSSYSVQKAVKSVYQRSQGYDCGWPINCATAIVVIKVLKSTIWGDAWKPWACRCQYATVWLWAFQFLTPGYLEGRLIWENSKNSSKSKWLK